MTQAIHHSDCTDLIHGGDLPCQGEPQDEAETLTDCWSRSDDAYVTELSDLPGAA